MNKLKNIDDTLKVRSCCYKKNILIVDTDRGKYVIKKKDDHNQELFQYLDVKNFHNYLNIYREDNYYEMYPYIDNINMTMEERALDIIYLISMLHNKTTFYKTVDLNKIKEIYEDVLNKLAYISNYYDNVKVIMEESSFIAPSGYLLLRNSSIIYECIDKSRYFIDKWYNLIKNKKSFRVATIHNNLELDHLLKGQEAYLISWHNACRASPIYDLISLYHHVYDVVSFSSLFDFYNSKYPLLEEEYYLLFALLLIPDRIDFNNRELLNTKNVYDFTNYLAITNSFVSKYYTDNSHRQA